MDYNIYRMFRGHFVVVSYGSGCYKGNPEAFVPTAITFKARTQKEATRKMDKFLQSAEIAGSFYMKQEDN